MQLRTSLLKPILYVLNTQKGVPIVELSKNTTASPGQLDISASEMQVRGSFGRQTVPGVINELGMLAKEPCREKVCVEFLL